MPVLRARHLATIGMLFVSTSAFSQTTPTVENGTLETHVATRGLAREVTALSEGLTQPVWIGYAVKKPASDSGDGCWTGDNTFASRHTRTVKLEGSDELYVLYRVASRQVERIRFASPECVLDAGGLAVHWLTGVTSKESLDYLTTFTAGTSARRLSNSAITAMALHADPDAADRLIALARTHDDKRVRSDALFWIAQRAGDKAVGVISDALDRDPDTEVKKRAVFALSQLPKDEGIPKLIEVARNNRNAEVRRQAMFWLGQTGDPRALKFFEDILR
jgi:HEAT repeats